MSKARDLADLGAVTSRLDTVGASDGALSNRNRIINGGLSVWQRGTSGASGSGVYTADRFKVWNTAIAQSTDVPSGEGFLYSAELTVTAQTSGNFSTIEQPVENEKTVAGQTFTFSFWIKGSASGTAVFRGYSQSNTVGFGHTAFNVTTSWQRIAVTVTAPTLGGGTSDYCAFGVDFNVNNVSGLSYAGSGVSEPSYTGTVYITGVQLEVGDTATPFEHPRSYGDELARCQRYYWSETGSGDDLTTNYATLYSSSYSMCLIDLPVTMRAKPTVSAASYTSTVLSNYHSRNRLQVYLNSASASVNDIVADAEL